jgi:hypothetical protein
MANSGLRPTVSSSSVSAVPLDQPSASAPPEVQPHSWPTTRETFSERSSALSTPAPLQTPPTAGISVEQLARETSAAQQNEADLRRALRQPLREQAKAHPDGNVRISDLRHGNFETGLQSDQALKALGSLSREDAMRAVREELRHTWPALSPADLDSLANDVQRQIGESLRTQSGWKMKKAAVSMMDNAAEHFRNIANDPTAVAQLISEIQKLPPTEQTRLTSLYGLDEPSLMQVLNPNDVADRLLERATLMEREGRELSQTSGGDRMLMAVADHDTRGAMLKSLGAKEGSWLAQAATAARHEGEQKTKNLTTLKVATSLAVGFATAGLGLAGVASIAVTSASSMAIKAPALVQSYRQVDAARAGESSGTMAEGAIDAAKANRTGATIDFVVGAAAPIVMGTAPVAHVVHHAEQRLVVHLGSEFVAKGAIHTIPHAVLEGIEVATHRHAPEGLPGERGAQAVREQDGSQMRVPVGGARR